MSKMTLPAGMKVPGAVWTVGIVIIVAIINQYVTDPFWINLVFVVLGLLLPMLVDNNAELKQALAAIQVLTGRVVVPVESEPIQPGMRGVERAPEPQPIPEVPDQPNPTMTYLFG